MTEVFISCADNGILMCVVKVIQQLLSRGKDGDCVFHRTQGNDTDGKGAGYNLYVDTKYEFIIDNTIPFIWCSSVYV